jgi:hypothetical protein
VSHYFLGFKVPGVGGDQAAAVYLLALSDRDERDDTVGALKIPPQNTDYHVSGAVGRIGITKNNISSSF